MHGLPSIRRRLTASLLWSALLCGVLTSGMVWYVVGHEINELMDQELREAAEIIHNVLAMAPVGQRFTVTTPGNTAYEENLVWQLVEKSTGEVKGRSHKAPLAALHPRLLAEPLDTPDHQWRVITLNFEHNPDRLLVVAQSQRERAEARASAALYTLAGSLLISLLAVLAINWQVRREFKPLLRLSRDLQAYDPLRPDSAPQSAGRLELLPIELAISDLGQRLARRVVTERAFTSHAAHALRTPLAGIDAQLAMALREAPEALRPRLLQTRQATTRLARVMQALLTMFRSGVEPQRQTVTLGDLLGPLVFNALELTVIGDEQLHVDPDLFAAVLLNLLDNAQRYQSRSVTLSTAQVPGWCRLRVHDDGQGCPPAQLTRIRQALARQDYSPGSGLKGLGLILADLVLRAHGGHVELLDVEKGFCIELAWPAMPETV